MTRSWPLQYNDLMIKQQSLDKIWHCRHYRPIATWAQLHQVLHAKSLVLQTYKTMWNEALLGPWCSIENSFCEHKSFLFPPPLVSHEKCLLKTYRVGRYLSSPWTLLKLGESTFDLESNETWKLLTSYQGKGISLSPSFLFPSSSYLCYCPLNYVHSVQLYTKQYCTVYTSEVS